MATPPHYCLVLEYCGQPRATADPAPPIRPPELRNGCAAALAAAAAAGWHLGVLTLCWCPPIVHALLPGLAAAEASVWSNRIDAESGACLCVFKPESFRRAARLQPSVFSPCAAERPAFEPR